MINIIKQSGKETAYVTEFVVDTVAEVVNLPVYPNVSKGSSAIVLEDSSVYILSGENDWKQL